MALIIKVTKSAAEVIPINVVVMPKAYVNSISETISLSYGSQ